MSELWRLRAEGSHAGAKVRLASVAGRQQGRVTDAQLRLMGVGRSTVRDWRHAGYLHLCVPRVYAVGSPARTSESDLFEAILYAGPGAMLSHASAAHWRGLIKYPPRQIQVSTPRRVRSRAGIVVHARRPGLTRTVSRGVPVTTVPQTLLDLAAQKELLLVRKALGQLDFDDQLDADELRAVRGRGRPGSELLQWAMANYDPRFADTYSPLEDDWLLVCERLDLPKPDRVGQYLYGIRCDNIYDDAMVIVELDGVGNHHTPAQIRRDRANDRKLRGYGWLVLRYTTVDVQNEPLGVRTDLLAQLADRARRAAARRATG